MRLSSVLIHLLVWAALGALWLLAGGLCCHYDGDMKGVCDLATVGGISSFAEISFALNTSIAIRWVREQFMSYFDEYAGRRIINYRVKHKNAKISDSSGDGFGEQVDILKRRFDSVMRLPARIYIVAGAIFSVVIAAMLFAGIPPFMKPFVALMPLPAMAYYMTAFLTSVSIFLNFDSYMHDRDLPGEADTDNATDDIAAVVKGAQPSVSKTKAKASASGTKKNGNGRKTSAK